MTARLLLASIILGLICAVASAQRYQIRVAYHTNLRASYSLDAARVETVPAGTILQVAGSRQRWLKIDRRGAEVWMASWVKHSRVENQPTGWPDGDTAIKGAPVAIEGGDGFRAQILEALALLRRETPNWYEYAVGGLKTVAQVDGDADSYINFHSKVFYLNEADAFPPEASRRERLTYTASLLVHEACHAHRHEAGFIYRGWQAREEAACLQMQLESYEALDPGGRLGAWLRELLENIENPAYQWWH